jgi:hypothetical protein
MRTYKLIGEGINQILEMTEEDGTIRYVPIDPANSDYQRYLNPEAEQSTPSVTDEAETK